MGRQLYRMYLYTVSVALLVLAAVGLGQLLNTLLAYTPLRGGYRPEPGQRELVQAIVFAVTAWVIAAVLGWLHLRLIRRDLAEFPDAGRGGVRAFFLNGAEAIAALLAVFMGAGGFSMLAYSQPSPAGDSTGQFSTAIAALVVVAALELEQRRYSVAPGVATVFRRLHTFGVPLVLLVVTTLTFLTDAIRTTMQWVLVQTGVYSPLDPSACSPTTVTYLFGPCGLPNVFLLWLAALVPLGAIAFYAIGARNDLHSTIRTVTHIASLSVGVGAVLFGLDLGFELLLRAIFRVPVSWSDIAHPWNANYDFISPLSIGVLLVVAYGLWLRAEKASLPPGARMTDLIAVVATAVIFAGAFWWGIGRIGYTALQWLAIHNARFDTLWAGAIALAIAGIAYIPLAVYLRRATTAETSAPRRGFILVLLAGGIVTGAVGLTMTLYSLGTWMLGAPLNNWEDTVRAGLAVLFVGVVLVVSYGWTAVQEHSIGALFKRLKEATGAPVAPKAPAQAHEAAPVPGDVTTAIEQTLTLYAAHSISLDEAAERIKRLMPSEAQAPQKEHALR